MDVNMKNLIILVLTIAMLILSGSKVFAEDEKTETDFPPNRVAAKDAKDPNMAILENRRPTDIQGAIILTPGALRPEDTPVGSDCPMCEQPEVQYNSDGTTDTPRAIKKRR
jgi:hypothetical protein